MPDDFCVAIYYAARSHLDVREIRVSGNHVEASIPLSAMPRRLASVPLGERLRVRFSGRDAEPSPLLDAILVDKQKTLGRHLLRLEVVNWDKLARYWRATIETPTGRA